MLKFQGRKKIEINAKRVNKKHQELMSGNEEHEFYSIILASRYIDPGKISPMPLELFVWEKMRRYLSLILQEPPGYGLSHEDGYSSKHERQYRIQLKKRKDQVILWLEKSRELFRPPVADPQESSFRAPDFRSRSKLRQMATRIGARR
jgi:hypothetical protein